MAEQQPSSALVTCHSGVLIRQERTVDGREAVGQHSVDLELGGSFANVELGAEALELTRGRELVDLKTGDAIVLGAARISLAGQSAAS